MSKSSFTTKEMLLRLSKDMSGIKGVLTQLVNKLSSVEGRLGSVDNRLDSVEGRLGSVENSLGSVEDGLGSVEDRLDSVEDKVELNIKSITLLNGQIYKLSQKVDVIDERTKSYPQLYNNVDSLMGEIVENRQERTMIHNRLTRLEKALLS